MVVINIMAQKQSPTNWTITSDDTGIVVNHCGQITQHGTSRMIHAINETLVKSGNSVVSLHSDVTSDTKSDSKKGKILVFHIMSGGGDLQGIYMLYDYIKLWKKSAAITTVKTYGHSLIGSAGAFWFALGDKGHRTVSKMTTALFHGPYVSLENDANNAVRLTLATQKKHNEFAVELFGKSFETLNATDVIMTADELVKAGIADNVV